MNPKHNKPNGPMSVLLLDNIPEDKVIQMGPPLAKRLWSYIVMTISIEVIVIMLTILGIVLNWDSGFTWTLIVRSLGQTRVIFLALSLCCELPVHKMIGLGKFFKIPKTLAVCPPLGIWAWIGLIDFFLIRIPMLFADIIYFTAFGAFISMQTVIYMLLGIAILGEIWMGVYLVYYRGIRKGIYLAFFKSRTPTQGKKQATKRTGTVIGAKRSSLF